MKKTVKFAIAASAVAMLMAGSAKASVTVYTSRAAFDAATGAQITETFSAPAGGYTFQGALFSTPEFSIADSNGGAYTVDPGFDGYYNWGTGPVYDAETGQLTITATALIRAIGFNFGNPAAYNSGNSTITVNGANYGGYAQPSFAFFGIVSDAAIAPISVNFNGGLGIIDNVSTSSGAVPEPATWGLMIMGFGLSGVALRSRRRMATAAI